MICYSEYTLKQNKNLNIFISHALYLPLQTALDGVCYVAVKQVVEPACTTTKVNTQVTNI